MSTVNVMGTVINKSLFLLIKKNTNTALFTNKVYYISHLYYNELHRSKPVLRTRRPVSLTSEVRGRL